MNVYDRHKCTMFIYETNILAFMRFSEPQSTDQSYVERMQ